MTNQGRSFGTFSFLGAATFLALASIPAFAAEVVHNARGHVQNPVWNADGTQVSFEINPLGGNIDLYVASVASGEPAQSRKVTLPGGASGFGGSTRVAVNSCWGFNGAVFFEATNSSGDYRLYFATPPGVSASELLDKTKVGGSLQYPSFSKSLDRVLFTSSETGAGDVRMWEPNSDTITTLTSTPGTEVFPLFSPDQQMVIFTRKNNGGEDVFVVDAASKVESAVAGGSGDQTRPAWAQGGNRVVYFSKASGSEEWSLMSVNANGSGRTVLGRNVDLPMRARPAVSPDGQWVAYATPGASAITIVKVDGSSTVEIETPHVSAGEPALTSSGGRTYLAYTGLINSDADWRRLHIMDITGRL